MMLHTPLRRLLVIAGLSMSVLSAGALAMSPAGEEGQMRSHMQAAMDPAKVDARLEKLKSALKLSSNQQAGWQRYADFVRTQAKQHREQFDKMRQETPPTRTPERLDRMNEHMQARMKSMETMRDETRRFYDGLTETQKTAFDQAMPKPRHGKH